MGFADGVQQDGGRANPKVPGHVTSEGELKSLGFAPLSIELLRAIALAEGNGCEWNTLGVVPEGPGHYLFTVETADAIRVTYAGLTTHLWMVTKGRLPRGGGARPGQRYGRPIYAGATRRRVNLLVAEQFGLGRSVRHWVRPMAHDTREPTASLRLVMGEEELIVRWRLRDLGWNRG
jgi:hypothetical protein